MRLRQAVKFSEIRLHAKKLLYPNMSIFHIIIIFEHACICLYNHGSLISLTCLYILSLLNNIIYTSYIGSVPFHFKRYYSA